MSSAEVQPRVSRDVRLGCAGIELRPLDVGHAAAFHEAVLESAAELKGTVPECLMLPVPRPVRRCVADRLPLGRLLPVPGGRGSWPTREPGA